MSTASFADLIAAAEAEGIGFYQPPNGKGEFRIANTNVGKTKNQDTKIGLHLAVDGGPDDGKKFWINLNFIPTNPKGLAFTFRDLAALGASTDVVSTWDLTSPDRLGVQVADALNGVRFSAEVQISENNGYTNVNLRNISRKDAPAATQPPVPGVAGGEEAPPAARPF